MSVQVIHGKAEDVLPTMESESVDAVICDPPYPGIVRDYGTWTEAEWFALMNPVVEQCRRILKPTGSAVFILQPNSERVGRMRTWLWDFMAYWGREWGIVQDVWWWNPVTPATVHCHRDKGGMRPSVKACVWLGPEKCWRDQDAVLWDASEAEKNETRSDRCLRVGPGGMSVRHGRVRQAVKDRGGVTPFNLLPIPNTSDEAEKHPGSTPRSLCRWWVRYICPVGGTVLDPFAGSGTVGLAAHRDERNAILIEKEAAYIQIIHERMAKHDEPLFRQPQPTQQELPT